MQNPGTTVNAALTLQHSQERYREVVENLAEGMFVVQARRIVFANRMASEILRIAPQDLMGADPVTWIHPEDQNLVHALRDQLQSQQSQESTVEMRHIGSDGVVRWLSVRPRVVPWEGGHATLTFFTEVTEQRAMMQALQRSEERYRLVVEHSGEGMLVVQNGRFVFINRRATELLEKDADTLMQGGYLDRIHPDDKALVDERQRRRLAGEDVPNRYEIRLLLPDGAVRWVEIGVTLVPWDGAMGTLTFFSDITERKNAEAAIKRNWAEREAILNTALVGMALSTERTLQWVNQRFADMLGYLVSELIGQSTAMLYDNEAQWLEYGRLQHAALLDRGSFSHERALRRRDGSHLWVQLDGKSVNALQPDAGVIWTLLDLTQRRKAEQETRNALAQQKELNELRSRFVAMTSHEFRTPLAAILSSAELLGHYGERMALQERQEVLRTIEASVHRMANMLDRVLMLERADAGMLEFKPCALEWVPWLEALINGIRLEWKSSQCVLHTDWSALPHSAQVDEKLLLHVFSNLLSNAFKYSPAGGDIRFCARLQDAELVFEVIDHGIGIPEQEQGHLFESFHRASNVGNISGTGLGLSIVKSAVDLHGGHIAVDSAPDRGSRFTVTLPYVPVPSIA